MKRFNKIFVLLTEEHYQEEIKKIKDFLYKIQPEKIYFDILIEEHDYFEIDFPKLKDDIKTFLKNNITINYELIEKNKEEEIIKFSISENIDLLILFNYRETNLVDDYIIKILTKSNSNILLIPAEYENLNIQKIMVATDFSDYSKEALEYGKYIQNLFQGSTIKIIHIAAIPVGYHYTGLSLEEFSLRLKDNANKKMKEFLKQDDIPYEIHTVYKHKKVVSEILRIAATEKMDLLILGSQGANSKLELFYPGSTTMKMVNIHTLPLLVVKIKERHKSLLEKIFLPS
ncbi:MAG: hypothetical protein KatS3mg129_0582 [Leptospiraceae bacterium]|nr:MAG: hypothetical protein KatS3mg129_0582 [Leptospiraceae bacterium]